MKEPVELDKDVVRSLRLLGQAQPPEGMERRIVERVRQRQVELSETSGGRNVWRWGFAVAAFAVIVVLMSHRNTRMKVPENRAAVIPPQRLAHALPTIITRTDISMPSAGVIRQVRITRVSRKRVEVAVIPHTPPPLPLTAQEHLLLALAHTPQLLPALVGVKSSETVIDHGLGQNSIFELDRENLSPMEPAHFTPLKSMPTGEPK